MGAAGRDWVQHAWTWPHTGTELRKLLDI